MNAFSLRTLIDDILLIVRNNNISESEDLSRAQIAAWIMHYRSILIKQTYDQNAGLDEDWIDQSMLKTIGPVELEEVLDQEGNECYTKQTKITLDDLLFKDPQYIISVTDESGCPIQRMHVTRRHFHYFRKYTSKELTWDYQNGNLLIYGGTDYSKFKYIWIKYIDDNRNAESEDDVIIQEWMVPTIKENIFNKELAFMVKMPSDDDNNSTLDGIKPHGAQDQEK